MQTFGFLEDKPRARKVKVGAGSRAKNTKGIGCDDCKLYEKVVHPKLEPFGRFEKQIYIQGEAPGENEDLKGVPFCGKAGKFFRSYFKPHGLDFERDCITVNTIDCRPAKRGQKGIVNRPPKDIEIRCCYHRKVSVLEQYKPKVILLLGEPAINSFYGCNDYRRAGITKRKGGILGIAALRGKVIPDRQLGAWVCHSYHPSYIIRGNEDQEHVFALDFSVFASMVGKPRPNFDMRAESIYTLTKFDEVMHLLDDIWSGADEFAFDYETSSFRVHEGIHDVHMISVAHSSKKAFVFPYKMKKPDGNSWWNRKELKKITACWQDILKSRAPKTAHNMKFEDKMSNAVFGTQASTWDWDTMVAAHVLDETPGVKGLKTQVYLNWGYHYGDEVEPFLKANLGERNNFEDCLFNVSALYCGRDALMAQRLKKKQKRLIRNRKLQHAYQLLHDGTLAFARMEERGIRFDLERAVRLEKDWSAQMEKLKDKIMGDKLVQQFKNLTGRMPKYDKKFSPQDLQVCLFDILKLRCATGVVVASASSA